MDEQLAFEAQNGDQEAMAQLLYNNYDIVFKYLVKITLNANTAEDLVQEAMIKAIEKINLYNPHKSKFSTWLITIAQNIYIDELRKQKREKKHVEEDVVLEDLIGKPMDDGSWESILTALSKLSDEIRLPVILRHYYGYSYEEIASIMGILLGTVKSRIHNGLKSLRKELDANE